jgi:hypothetical protein
MFKTVRFLALLFAVCLTSASLAADADEKVHCEEVASIGVATITQDGVIKMQIRSLPPGPIAEGVFQYGPGDPKYGEIKQHLGGIAPGESKPVRPWC